MMTGNKGEWSEIYVFLKLLADGRLDAADANLNVIPNIYYPIIKILRQENNKELEYCIKDEIRVFDENKNELIHIPVIEFINNSKLLFSYLRSSQGRSFAFEDIEDFLNSIKIFTLSATSTDKSDINLVVHDLKTGLEPKLGFSIKSMIGKDATLFNAGSTTNFIYEIIVNDQIVIDEINAIQTKPKIANRIQKIRENGCSICFRNIQSDTLQLNLQLIDSDLPKILAELIILKYTSPGDSSIALLVNQLTINNPLNFNLSQGHPFYEYKIKNFLTDSALGMTPAAKWNGNYDATGGLIIVKENGDLVCYHIYNHNEFQDYLFNNTRLEQASTSRYGFGDLYQENGKLFIKLNLQVRFS
ncbi:MAG: HpaII family restriction endonuclease [Dysgonamonadaceae bacterium]|nr:HpaII family restriction endonuclease [Dysgonamonadaceae bacterium]MEA5080897.1 HpaII family restriction endonuclease [Dysgonamonadaceae bacterium]